MSKPKRRSQSGQRNNPKPRPAQAEPTAAPAARPESRPAPARRTNRGGSVIGVLIVIGVMAALIGGAIWYFRSSSSSPSNAAKPNVKIGGVTCREFPKFAQDLGFNASAALSTSERNVKGLALIDSGTPRRVYQDPSWSKAGSLAPIEFGSAGTVYVAPAPSINVLDNPPDQQNQIYRVDGKTGQMASYINLPRAAPVGPENPFGVLGLGYDCETNSLYASSVAGSTRDKEVGRLYRINTAKGTVEGEFDGVDPLGLAVFNGTSGKRLYYALARLPEIWSIGLDAQGNFQGQPRKEISLADLGPRGSDKGRDIKFNSNNQMEVYGIEFSFNLIAPTEKQETLYRFNYDQPADKWLLAAS